jgi:hypothetical protein
MLTISTETHYLDLYSPPSRTEVKYAWSYTSAPPIRLHGVVLSEAQGQLYLLTFYIFILNYKFSLQDGADLAYL